MLAIDNAKTVSGLKEYMHGGEIFQRWILLLIYYDRSQWSPTPRKVVPDFCQLPSNRSHCCSGLFKTTELAVAEIEKERNTKGRVT